MPEGPRATNEWSFLRSGSVGALKAELRRCLTRTLLRKLLSVMSLSRQNGKDIPSMSQEGTLTMYWAALDGSRLPIKIAIGISRFILTTYNSTSRGLMSRAYWSATKQYTHPTP